MFLHLGGDNVVPYDQVIAVLDYDLRLHSKISRKFLEHSDDLGQFHDVSEGNPKSVVVTTKGVYLSQISCATLKKRGHSNMAELGNYLK